MFSIFKKEKKFPLFEIGEIVIIKPRFITKCQYNFLRIITDRWFNNKENFWEYELDNKIAFYPYIEEEIIKYR